MDKTDPGNKIEKKALLHLSWGVTCIMGQDYLNRKFGFGFQLCFGIPLSAAECRANRQSIKLLSALSPRPLSSAKPTMDYGEC